MQEIEVKVKTKDNEEVIRQLEAAGCVFTDAVHQDDVTYATTKESMDAFMRAKVFVRIRKIKGGDTVFTVKYDDQRHVLGMAATEHEVTVNSAEELEQMLLLMGFVKIVRVQKTRRKTTYKNYELCVDDVEELGSYMEIEKLAEKDADPRAVHEELVGVLESLGIDLEGRVSKGYDILMLDKEGFV
ncbi:class IV adenylate cyclase [Patescibacteria group bacterium]|nr:class IV adenylate cyclase [Patescibacteria group bacterium]